jgi:DNA-directed RNA polymerase specialized sigma24 family protein
MDDSMNNRHRFFTMLTVSAALLLCASAYAQGGRPLVPSAFVLDQAASKAIAAQWLTDDERRALRVFHGVWDERDLTTPALTAAVALNAWRFDDPVFADPATPVELRAQALVLAGEAAAAVELLKVETSLAAVHVRCEAFEMLGNQQAAKDAAHDAIKRLLDKRSDDPADLTDGVGAMIVRTRIEGQPARDFQTMLDLLSRARSELDRLYWPAFLTEAQLLQEKDVTREAVDALHQTMSLNPRCAEGWYLLGRVALQRFDFTGALAAGSVFDLEGVPDSVTAITTRLARDESVTLFLERAEQLDPIDRGILVHLGLEGLNAGEAAERLGISREMATKRWQRLRARLREQGVGAGLFES